MKIFSYTDARKNFASVLDGVVDDAEETVIHRAGHEAVVLIPLSEWNSYKETAYLLSNPANAQHLRDAIDRMNKGHGQEHDLIDPESVTESRVA